MICRDVHCAEVDRESLRVREYLMCGIGVLWSEMGKYGKSGRQDTLNESLEKKASWKRERLLRIVNSQRRCSIRTQALHSPERL